MKTTLAIASRELGSLFRLPVGWVVIALFLFLTGVVFGLFVVASGQPASMRGFFGVSAWLLLPAAPAVSMRLLAEETRSGTIEPLLSSPATDLSIVLGKYLAALGFLVLMLAPTLAHVWILAGISEPKPDPGPIAAGYLCLLLLGGFYLAAGLFASSLTSNQTLAFLATLFGLLILLLVSFVPVDAVPPVLRTVARELSIAARVGDFAKGVVDPRHVAFFAGGAAVFLALSWASLQSRRWR